MPNIGNSTASLVNLTERLKSKAEMDRQTAERLIEAEFKSLSLNVRASMKNALTTIEDAMRRETATIREITASQNKLLRNGFIWRWLVGGLLGLGLTFGLALGAWGLSALAQRHILNLREEVAALNQQRTALEATLAQLKSQTWGVSLIETDSGRFIVPPPKAKLKTGWTVGDRPALKLE